MRCSSPKSSALAGGVGVSRSHIGSRSRFHPGYSSSSTTWRGAGIIVSVASNHPFSNSSFAGAPPPRQRKSRQCARTPPRRAGSRCRCFETRRRVQVLRMNAWRRCRMQSLQIGNARCPIARARTSRWSRHGRRSRSQMEDSARRARVNRKQCPRAHSSSHVLRSPGADRHARRSA